MPIGTAALSGLVGRVAMVEVIHHTHLKTLFAALDSMVAAYSSLLAIAWVIALQPRCRVLGVAPHQPTESCEARCVKYRRSQRTRHNGTVKIVRIYSDRDFPDSLHSFDLRGDPAKTTFNVSNEVTCFFYTTGQN